MSHNQLMPRYSLVCLSGGLDSAVIGHLLRRRSHGGPAGGSRVPLVSTSTRESA